MKNNSEILFWFMYEPELNIWNILVDTTIIKFKWRVYRIIAEFTSYEKFIEFSKNYNQEWILRIEFKKDKENNNKCRVIKIIENIE